MCSFVDGQNIAKIPVPITMAESINLSGAEAQKIIQERSCKEAVDLDWKRSYEFKINAIPTFVFNYETLVGAQKYETLEMLVLNGHE